MRAIKLKTERMRGPMGIDAAQPLFTWVCEGGIRQTACEVAVYETDGKEKKEWWRSGKVQTSAMRLRLPAQAALKSRQSCLWQVRLWDENDVCGEWSEEAFFETAFLEQGEWKAKWINPETPVLEGENQPASCLKKNFTVEKTGKARLYITAHGLYVARLNGVRVGEDLFTPGTGEYEKRLQYQTYDVTELLHPGENTLEVTLGNGWYRGSNGMVGTHDVFGKDIALLCQLEVDKKPVRVSDETWLASQSGPVRANDMQQGEVYDAGKERITDWHPVRREDHPMDVLVCGNSVPVREHEVFEGKVIPVPNGEIVVDFGQNMAGYTQICVTAAKGQKITLTHGETLDENGNFTTANFQPGGRTERTLEQKLTYICKEGENSYKPDFAIFGFRYVKVETDLDPSRIRLTAHAVYSDMEQTGAFSCSDERVNQLVRNALWSQKSNFVDVPTDCPTRERAGYTGDAQVYIPTALYLMDAYPVFAKWLSELRLVQFADGTVPGIAPKQEEPEGFSAMMAGSAGWGDACVIVPYVLWKRYQDTKILEDNYEMMKGWVERCRRLAEKSRPENEENGNPWMNYVVDTGCHWGEWLEPDIPSEVALRNNLMKGAPEVATAYFFYSTKLLSEIAETLGKAQDAQTYGELAEKIKKAYNSFVLKDRPVVSDRQCEYVRPIALGLLDEEREKEAAADLNDLVIKNDYHLNTGFLSTPHLCRVLSDHGYVDTAYRLLLQDTCPGWLYAVKKGATTIWETWDGVREDGTVHDSMNHYSYGAIVGWLFDSVCGIRVQGEEITVAPTPGNASGAGLEEASAVYDSPLGRIESGWKHRDGKTQYRIVIPANTEATICLPGQKPQQVCAGTYIFT